MGCVQKALNRKTLTSAVLLWKWRMSKSARAYHLRQCQHRSLSCSTSSVNEWTPLQVENLTKTSAQVNLTCSIIYGLSWLHWDHRVRQNICSAQSRKTVKQVSGGVLRRIFQMLLLYFVISDTMYNIKHECWHFMYYIVFSSNQFHLSYCNLACL